MVVKERRGCLYEAGTEPESGTILLHPGRGTISDGTAALNLPPQELALLGVYVLARAQHWPGAGPDGCGQDHRGWITTSEFINPPGSNDRAFRAYINLYTETLGNRDPAPIARLFRLSRTAPDALQQFFQRKRTLLNKYLESATAGSIRHLRLHTSRTRPHRAGLLLQGTPVIIL